jgi:putative Mg2+ transporter-C (MgtC) family protein
VIGILVGVGFYAAAMGLALLSAMVMIYLSRIEAWLPSRHAIAITMRFKPGFLPSEESLRKLATERGYEIAGGSLMIAQDQGRMEWRFVALALGKRTGTPLSLLAAEMARFEGIDGFQITHARN